MSDYRYKLSPYSQKILNWMSERGHVGYQNEIDALEERKMEMIGEAGRYWQDCEYTRQDIQKINDEIEDVARSACDRYEDWASD